MKKFLIRPLSILLSLVMVLGLIPGMSLTAFAAPTETLLTKITPTGIDTYSESVAGVVTVTLSNISRFSGGRWAYGGTVTVAPKAGYTITKCIFDARAGAVEDTEAPFSIDVGSVTNVGSVEVYGYQAPSSSYVDGSGKSQTVNATELAANTTNWTDGSWYIAPAGGITISGRITVNGTVNLILRDGATLTASAGITTTNATLNIYAQSAGTGTLTAKGSNGGGNSAGRNAGIGGCGGAYEENGGAGGTVSIFGGTVTATGGNSVGGGAGAGIGGGGAGLGRGQTGGAGGTVSIFGGTVTATGGDSEDGGAGAGIGGGGKEMRGSDGASGTLTLGAGVKLYNGTNKTGTLLDGSDSTERTYSGSRPQKMFAEFISAGSVDKTALNNAITAAQTLYDSIKDDTNYSTIASTLKTALDAAKAVADSDEADQDAVDAAKTAITTAKTNAEAAKKDVDDTNAANAVIAKINALPASTAVTTDNREAIVAARAAYDALTDDQKAKVNTDILTKLTEAETALSTIDQTEAGNVATLINNLPAATDVTTANRADIAAARAAYNALDDAQKALVSDGTLQKLTDAESALTTIDQTASGNVATLINNLPAATDVSTANEEAIEAARAAYDALDDAQKALVDADTLKKLTDAEDALAAVEVSATINNLPAADAVTADNKDAIKDTIEEARAAYDALTEAQKKLVDKNTLKKLTDDEEKLAELQAMSEVSAKTGKDATYNGKELPLVNAPTSELPQGCTMKYALGKDADTPPADDQFTADVPTAKDAGTYYVWYKAVGDEGHPSTEPECKIVRLAKAVLTVIAKNQTVQYGNPVVQGRYTVKGLAKGDKVVVQLYAKLATNEVKSTVTANKNYTVKKVSGILTIKGSPNAKALPSGKTITVSYAKVKNADGYDIYAGYCGSNSYPLAKTMTGNSVTATKLTKIGGKAIDTKKNVFLYVVAYKNVGGKKVTLVRSASIRIAGLSTKHTNAKSVGGVKPAVTLKKGATLILKPSVTPVDPKKPVYANPAKFMFASHNNSVAKVDAKGRITAVGKGTANIYTYAPNGVKTKITVTVK